MKKNLIVILGPTASGKTTWAVRLAAGINGEIISADSRQVFKAMDIGTGKDLSEYHTDQGMVPYHLIDILEPEDEFNVFEFQKRFDQTFNEIRLRNALPILVGGTGLYLESVIANYEMPYAAPDEDLRKGLSEMSLEQLRDSLLRMKVPLHNRTDMDDRERLIRKIEIERSRKKEFSGHDERPFINAAVFGVYWDRAVLRQRIAKRLHQRMEGGMMEEVRQLRLRGLSWERLDRFGLEYRHVAWYLQGKMTKQDMTEKLAIAIGQFAKRQMTWFRRMEKKGIAIEWISGDDYDALRQKVNRILT